MTPTDALSQARRPHIDPDHAAPLSLRAFEQIDGLHSQLGRMGDFMACADPRGYIRLSNRLFDACHAAGMSFDEPNHEEWAAGAILRSLVSA